MTTFSIVLSIFVMLLSLISFGLSIFLLFKLGQEKGIGHAILGFLFFPYPYIWGWINVKRLQIMDVMLALTFMMVISFIAPIVMVAAMTTAGIQSLAQQSNQSGPFISSNDDFQSTESIGTELTLDDGSGNVSYSFSTSIPIEMGTITVGTPINANIEDGLDEHDWTFQGTTGQQISIVMRTSGDLNPDLKLISPDGAWIADGEDGDSPTDAQIMNFTLPSDGAYTIRVGVFGLDGGQYLLSVK